LVLTFRFDGIVAICLPAPVFGLARFLLEKNVRKKHPHFQISVTFAIFNILMDIAILIWTLVNFKTYPPYYVNSAMYWVSIGNAIVNAVASAFVIYGYFKRNPGFYLPYMMINVSKIN
jgi:hypothetical protein